MNHFVLRLAAALAWAISCCSAFAQSESKPSFGTPVIPGTTIYALDAQMRSVSLPSESITTLNQALIVGSSYLEGINLNDRDQVIQRLIEGECKNETPCRPRGSLQFSKAAAQNFVNYFSIVKHMPNDDSGFSATLLKDRHLQQYILAIRGAETLVVAGEKEIARDALNRSYIKSVGIAMAQGRSADSFLQAIKAQFPDYVTSHRIIVGIDLGAHLSTLLAMRNPRFFHLTYISQPILSFQ